MKSTFALVLTCLLGISSQHCFAQAICGFDSVRTRLLRNNPMYQKTMLDAEASIRAYIKQHPGLRTSSPKTITGGNPSHPLTGPYMIPVVVHVIHTGGAIGSVYNPTDQQIKDALTYLNQVYNGTYPGTVTSGLGAGDLGIQFVLAKRDPDCNPTNGINRVDGSGLPNYAAGGIKLNTTIGDTETLVKNLSRWDNTKYYNIWIVNKIDGNDGTSGQFVAGYAYLPGANSNVDGIVMLATQMSPNQKTLPHEIGHAFGLYHPFQGSQPTQNCPSNTNCSLEGDLVCDTDPVPENIDFTTGIIDFNCRTGLTDTCTGAVFTDATESNYMSYTNCYTLFTPGQATRMQAVTGSLLRSSLTTSLGGTAPDAACGPRINFELSGDRQTETPTTTASCRSYTDYTYNMVIGIAPSATAIATLNMSGTAIQGTDYDITTNGSFTSPSQQLTFPASSTNTQSFTIRIYDDASVNGTRTLTLGFTVNNGGGNAVVGTGRPTFTMIIDDNDIAPTAGIFPTGNPTIGTTAASTGVSPFDATQPSQRVQFLYKASELTAAGIPAGILSAVGFQVKTKSSTRPFTNLHIKIGATTASYLYDGVTFALNTPMTVVKSLASYSTTAGINNFTFDTPWTWDGTSNVVIEVCYDNNTSAASAGNDPVWYYSDGGSNSQYASIYQNAINCDQLFNSVSAPGAFGFKPLLYLTYGVPATSVQTVLNSSQSQYLGPLADVYFYDQSTGQLMARIQNLSSFDYGCTQVVIDRAGNSAQPFWNNNTSNYLMDKTFHVIPTTNNSSGSYNITLYYTQTEMNGWQSITSQNPSSIQLVKVPGQISSVTTANPNGAGTVTIVTPTISTLGTNTGLTYGFSNGFSGFGAGIPDVPLPISLLRFEGRLDNNNAVLNWTTSFEDGNKGFEVDRSFDGTHFSRIGFVPSAGNSNTEHSYSFTDPSLTRDTNYYRLKQVDLDDRFTYSKVVLIRDPHVTPSFTVLPNPFNDQLDIVFGQVQTGKIRVRLLDATGRELVQTSGVQSTGSHLHLALPGLSAGVYLLEVRSDTGTQIQRVLKK